MRLKHEVEYLIQVRVTISKGHLFFDRTACGSSHKYGQTIYHQTDGWVRLSWHHTSSAAKEVLTQIVSCMSVHNGARAEVRVIKKVFEEVECIHLT